MTDDVDTPVERAFAHALQRGKARRTLAWCALLALATVAAVYRAHATSAPR
jgi:hypothetical protein